VTISLFKSRTNAVLKLEEKLFYDLSGRLLHPFNSLKSDRYGHRQSGSDGAAYPVGHAVPEDGFQNSAGWSASHGRVAGQRD
jgi:hypothetical protein